MIRSRAILVLAMLAGCGDDGSGSATEPDSASGSGGTSGSSGSSGATDEGTSAASGESTGGSATTDGSTGATTAWTTGAMTTSATSEGESSGTSAGTTTEGADPAAPDFSLIDVNSNSATFEDAVSPRDYLEMVSGWYFTHAT